MSTTPNNFAKQKSKIYFGKEAEKAIIDYNNCNDFEIKSKIYQERIHFAFFKLTQNIIHTFKFYHTEVEDIEDLQHEVITFLLSKIHLFDPSKGAKAYSYFGTIAKRYLILNNDKNYKKKVDTVSITILEQDEKHSYNIEEGNYGDKLSYFIDCFTEHYTKEIYNIFPKEIDAKIADAILELFKKREHLEIFNKKALYIYIREQIDVKTPKITKVADKLHKYFKQGYIFYLNNGYIKM